jgi:1-acyl-sn-glycerol-3-phosphate acyltransferase
MIFIRQLIGVIALLCIGISYVLCEVVLWLTATPVSLLAPRKLEPVLRFNVRLGLDATAGVLRLFGARLDVGLRVPAQGGILIVSNHQSLVDIVVAFLCVPDAYPQMVAHYRYMRGIPLVSHMLRLYGHIPVYPGRKGRVEIERLGELARAAEHPIVIYPEGHRTPDGEIQRWKRAGLQAFLSARPWTVHVLVVDGLWKSARLPDFIRTVTRIRCRAEAVGPFEYDGTGQENHDEFIDRLERAMCDKLAQMRSEEPASQNRDHERGETVMSS